MVQTREADLRDVPEKKKELDRLIQERDSTRKLYEELLNRYGQSEVSKQMEIGDKTTTFRIVDPAILPRVPVSPDMIKMILLAIAAGAGAGFGTIVLLEKLDSSIKDLTELKSFGVRVLAQIPSIVEPETLARVKRKNLAIYSGVAVYDRAVCMLIAYEGLFRMRG
ncbi:MAG: GNVR domain-containing protein [Syntrophotaleaceae bacterium]